MNWHANAFEDILEEVRSATKGLSGEEAALRLETNGPNELEEKKRKSPLMIFLAQFKDFMILALLFAAIISGVIGEMTDTLIILIIVLLNAIIGFVQEYRAEKAMQMLKKMAAIQATVQREGTVVKLPAADLVIGDVVLLDAGNAVPADLRILEAHSLRIDESALTGEALAVDKSSEKIEGENIPLGDRLNMAYKSTLVTNGRGLAVVVATGMNTEIGKIARLLQEGEMSTPLQRRMADFGKRLSLIILGICIILFGVGLLRGEEPLNMLLLSISLAVAAIPEALPALITIALALGAKHLVQQNALIRKLPAVEALGSVSFICSDKTGTLTMNKMKVVQVQEEPTADSHFPLSPLRMSMALNHDVRFSKGEEAIGDSTELALVEYVMEENGRNTFNVLSASFPRVAELPFDADRKCMSSVHVFKDRYVVFTKGAIESIARCLADQKNAEKLFSLNEEWAAKGLRVLAFAYKYIDVLPDTISIETLEKDLVFTGLAGMIDPPRPEAKAAIEECITAGIKPVMITGDHPATALSIAKEVGIWNGKGYCVSGVELEQMSEDDLQEKVEHISVYARVSPEQKIRIVKALQSKGHSVSMTGDGVNDAPSLRAADIGVAMGINGTDVSKEAADMILLDDNFATIVKAVREGRRIYDNIRKFVKYIMTCNGAEIWTIFLAPLAGLPIPLLPIHILWINLVTDGLPGLALANEKAEEDVMRRPPSKSDESLFSGGVSFHILWVGLLMAGVTLATQQWAVTNQLAHWQTMVFTILSLSQLGHVLAIRSDKTFLYMQGIFSNRMLIGAIAITVVLQMMIIYLPFANEIFKTQPLTLKELLICIGMSAVVFHAVELEKWIKRKMVKRNVYFSSR
ncbi:MAG: cation-translocating P-type ATPase [Bacteroidetes bacterium]|nr:cation-translocating P-type ATPase [Bacteroidota bacterium]